MPTFAEETESLFDPARFADFTVHSLVIVVIAARVLCIKG